MGLTRDRSEVPCVSGDVTAILKWMQVMQMQLSIESNVTG